MAPKMAGRERMKPMPATSVAQVAFSKVCRRAAVAHRRQQHQRQHEAHGHRAEDHRVAEGIEKPAERRPDHRRRLPGRRVPGDGVGEILLRHQVRHQRLARRNGEGAADAEDEDQQVDRPDGRRAVPRHGDQPGRRQRRQREADEKDGAPVVAVGDVPGDQGKPDRRQERREADQPERQRAVGDVVDQPADRDRLHLHRAGGENADGKEENEVAMPEGRPALPGGQAAVMRWRCRGVSD